jgi:orotate phosphoribosyltransferase
VQEELIALLSGRRGHFRMESGYHSERWFNLNALFADLARLQPFVRELARQLAPLGPGVVCGPESGGARLAEMIARELGCASCPTERHDNPAAAGLFPVEYRVPARRRDDLRGKAVVIVDDAISAGSAIKGSHASLVAAGARPVACGALVIFGDKADRFATEHQLPLFSVARASFAMWPPAECPLCRSGLALEAVSDATS